MPIYAYKSTNILHAFILNSVATTFIVTLSLLAKDYIEHRRTSLKLKTSTYLILALITFVASMVSFYTLHVLFGFGGGMMT